jgi:hypothetical protein
MVRGEGGLSFDFSSYCCSLGRARQVANVTSLYHRTCAEKLTSWLLATEPMNHVYILRSEKRRSSDLPFSTHISYLLLCVSRKLPNIETGKRVKLLTDKQKRLPILLCFVAETKSRKFFSKRGERDMGWFQLGTSIDIYDEFNGNL